MRASSTSATDTQARTNRVILLGTAAIVGILGLAAVVLFLALPTPMPSTPGSNSCSPSART